MHCPVNIDNTVCTFGLGVSQINVSELYQRCPAVHYDPESFGAAVVQLQSPRCTCLVFSSGMGVCVGARSFAEAHLGVTTMTNVFRLCGFTEFRTTHFAVRNIVGSLKFPTGVDLDSMSSITSVPIMYNPDLFPGLRCKPMSNKSSCAIVYATGAVVLTGCLTVDECNAFGKTMAALCTPYFCDIASCDARAVKRRKSGPSI